MRKDRRKGRIKVLYRCFQCNHEFKSDGRNNHVILCPKCGCKDLWGKPYNEPN